MPGAVRRGGRGGACSRRERGRAQERERARELESRRRQRQSAGRAGRRPGLRETGGERTHLRAGVVRMRLSRTTCQPPSPWVRGHGERKASEGVRRAQRRAWPLVAACPVALRVTTRVRAPGRAEEAACGRDAQWWWWRRRRPRAHTSWEGTTLTER